SPRRLHLLQELGDSLAILQYQMPRASKPGIISPRTDGEARANISFEGVWAELRNRLQSGAEITGWSHEQDDTGLRFKIVYVAPDAITIQSSSRPEQVKPQERRIGKTDFARVYAIWRDYCGGNIKRAETTQISQNTSYIFSILR